MKKAVKILTSLVIQCAVGFTKTNRVARKSQTIGFIRPDVTKEEILAAIAIMRPAMVGEITSVKLVTKKITTIWTPEMRVQEQEEKLSEQELLAQEGVPESMTNAAQNQQTQQTPAIIGDVDYAAANGIDFSGLSGNALTNTEAQPFGAGATPNQGLENLNIFDVFELTHRNPLVGTATEVGYMPPVSVANAPLYGLPPLPQGGL